MDFKKNRAQSAGQQVKGFEQARMQEAERVLRQASSHRVLGEDLHFEAASVSLHKNKLAFRLSDLTLKFGEQALAAGLYWEVRQGQRLALEGEHGCGKSSLLKALAGERAGIQGGMIQVFCQSQAMIQQILPLQQHTDRSSGGRLSFSAWDWLRAHPRLAEMPEPALRNELARFLLSFDLLSQPLVALSGGEKVRLQLASAFLPETPQLLLVDEVTNHLDLEAIQMLESTFQTFDGTLILVSHDEYFKRALNVERVHFRDLTPSSSSPLDLNDK